MAFGAGAIIEACAIELFGHMLHVSREREDPSIIVIAILAAVVGGLFF